MSEFMGFNALVRFDQGVVRIIRREASAETLAECEKNATRVKVLGVDVHKHKLFEVYSHLAFIVDPNETTFKVQSANDNRPNMVLIEKSQQWDAAQPVIQEIQAALANGEEVFYLNLDPSKLPAQPVKSGPASPEWQGIADEIKSTLLATHKDGYSFFIIGVGTPEFGDSLYFQGLFPQPDRVHLEVAGETSPSYNPEIIKALTNAGWASPVDYPNYSIEVAWHYDQADAVASFLANTLQWCLFLDAASVRLTHDITQDS
jgi:hypothetical protein